MWTYFMKRASWIALCIGVLASLALGINYLKVSGRLSFAIIVMGIMITVLSIGVLMVICEISENIEEINRKITRNIEEINRKITRLNYSSSSSAEGNEKSTPTRIANTIKEPSRPVDYWKCPNCGRQNSKTDMFCKDCGTSK